MTHEPTPAERGLPELPASIGIICGRRLTPEGTREFFGHFHEDREWGQKEQVYTADQMRAYALAALSARPLPSDWVAVPRDPVAALPILRALADAAGLERLPDPGNPDDAYPITGAQSTVLQWYRAMLAAAPSAPAEAVQTAPEPLAQGEPLGYTAIFNAIAAATWPATEGVAINVSVAKFHESIGGNVYASPQPAAEAETFLPAGWYSFVHDCAQKRGMEVNGNRLSMKAEELLASLFAAPNPPQPSASVGERARELLAQQFDSLNPLYADCIRKASPTDIDDSPHVDAALRAIESALTTAAAGGGLRELVVRWRHEARDMVEIHGSDQTFVCVADALEKMADELESLLAGGVAHG